MTLRAVRNDGHLLLAAKAKRRRRLSLAGCLLLLVALGWLDYITGYEMSFFVFYSVPVGIAAWYLGQCPAIGVALAATASWLLADYFGGVKYSAPFYYYWNSTIHFLAFIINAVTIAKIKSDLDRRHVLAAELESAQETLRVLSSLLPACPVCGKAREEANGDQESQLAIFARLNPALADTICADCRSQAVDEISTAPASSSAVSASVQPPGNQDKGAPPRARSAENGSFPSGARARATQGSRGQTPEPSPGAS
jgi:hypothetical protein